MLRSAVDELLGEDPSRLAEEALESDFVELQRTTEVLNAERLRWLAEIDRRQPYRREGFLSTASWLAQKFRMSWSEASRQMRLARALREMPEAQEALGSGEVSSSAVEVLASAREANPEEFRDQEQTLLEAARTLSIRQLRSVVAYWRQAVDADRALEDSDCLRDRRRLHVSSTIFGMVRVDGDLDPETGETLLTALRSVQDADARAPGDQRTPSQRRADALEEICLRWLDSADRPTVAGERPHVTVTVDLEALKGQTGHRSEFDHTGPIHPQMARRWACDASVSRVITKGSSEPLDVGRRTPVVPAPLRRAVVVRDHHCRFPGCERPNAWCDAHHVVHWADGGSTALSNLLLLCRPHHRLVHAGFQVDTVDGRASFRRRDGSILEDRAPPTPIPLDRGNAVAV